MCLLANKNWHWQAVSSSCCYVLLLLSTNTERQVSLNVSRMPGSVVQSPSSMSFFLSQYSPLPWPALRQMVERSLGRHKLQGRCLWNFRSEEKNCQGDRTSREEWKKDKKRGDGSSPGTQHLLAWCLWALSLRCISKQKIDFPPKQADHLFYFAVWHNIHVDFDSLVNEVESVSFNWDIRALICHIWIIVCGIVLLKKGFVGVFFRNRGLNWPNRYMP